MQIEDWSVVKFLSGALSFVAISFTGLYWYVWRGDRTRLQTLEGKVPPELSQRLKTLEDKMSQAVTMPQVEHIVERVEKHFKEDHSTIIHGQRAILTIIDNKQDELKDYIRDMFDAREDRWDGRNRRKK